MSRHPVVALAGLLSLLAAPAGAAPSRRPPAASVLVNPPTADIVLGDCDVVDDTLTVLVPPHTTPRAVDVYLLADTTGSMEPALDSVRRGALEIIRGLRASLPGVRLRIGVGSYRDFPNEAYAFDHQLSPTADRDAIVAAIHDWEARSGGDAPEGQMYALDRIAKDVDPDGGTIGWRPQAERIVVWFGDAPGHDPICPEISGLAGSIDEDSVTDALVDAGIEVVAISTLTGYEHGLDDDPARSTWAYQPYCDVRAGEAGQATRITEATGGAYREGVDDDAIVDTIVGMVRAEVRTIERLELVPSAELSPFVADISDPVGPLSPRRREQIDFDVRYVGDLSCRAEDRVFDGTLDVLADGAKVAAQRVTVTVPACR